MAIIPVPQLSDNYAYLVVDDASKECGVVDCAEADKVLAAVKQTWSQAGRGVANSLSLRSCRGE